MSYDDDRDELDDVRIPVSLLNLLSQATSDFKARILRQALRRAVVKSGNQKCVLGKDELSESIQAAFREGPSEWLKAFAPDESTHVRRAS